MSMRKYFCAFDKSDSVTNFSRTNFDVEIVSFISDFHDLWPRKSMNSQLFLVDQDTTGTYSNQDVNAIRILQIHLKA